MHINHTKLNNGLTIITEHVENVESIAINITVKVGSRNESKNLNGITHFLEHMAFKGTNKRTAKKIAEEFDSIGGYFNAYTSREFTTYTVKILKEHAITALDILADIIQYSVFLKEEIEKERSVILQEIASTNDSPDDIIFDIWHELAFNDQDLGRSILGTEETISKFDSSLIKDYVSKYYTYNNITISIVGNLKHDEMVAIIEKDFNNLSDGKKITFEKAQYKGGFKYIKRDLEQAHLIMGWQGCNYFSDDFYPMHLFSTILGGGMSSRLFQEIRENRGLAYSVGSFFNSYSDDGVFGVYVAAEDAKLPEIMDIVKAEILDVSKNMTISEYDRALIQLKSSLLMSQESTSSKASDLSKSLAIYNRHITPDEIMEKLNNVSKEDISGLIEKILTSDSTVSIIAKENIVS